MTAMILSDDFNDFIRLLNKHEARYVLVGGWAVIFEGYPRLTGDMDILVDSSLDNAKRVLQVLTDFFGSTIGYTIDDLTRPDNVLMMGKPPNRIDILTSISGVTFDQVFETSHFYEEGDLRIRCIHINELIRNKEASGRLKDLADADILKKIRAKRTKRN